MGSKKNDNKKLAFIKKYNLKKGGELSNDIVCKARDEIGYSKNTTSIDIKVALSSFLRRGYNLP